MREPENERDAQRAHERRGENGVDRAHVRDDGAPAEAGQLARQRSLEAGATNRPVAGAERPHAAVVRQHARNRAVREHDDLVDERRERGDLGHGRRERRVPRIDLLGDEDELAPRSEEVEVAEREVPRVGALVDVDTVVERLADEAKLLVRRREACPDERAAMRRTGREQDERVGAALHLGGGARHERANGRASSGAATRSARKPAETPCLNV